MSSSEPLREMRADLQVKIRNLVEEVGPELFEDFQKTRVVPKEMLNADEYHRVAAEKLGRGRKASFELFDEEAHHLHINTVFGKEVDKIQF